MSRVTRSRPHILAAVGTFFLAAAALASLDGQPGHVDQPDPTRWVADCLDSLIQPRFQDDRAGVFGLTRIVTPEQMAGVNGHMGLALLQPKTPIETALLHQANAAERDYVVAFLHCAHVPGHFKNIKLRTNSPDVKPYLQMLATRPSPQVASAQQVRLGSLFSPSHLGKADYAVVSEQAITALPRLRQGTYREASVNNWLVVMRPVRALQVSCLGCHTGAKHGDTLGVMVYAVSRKPRTGG